MKFKVGDIVKLISIDNDLTDSEEDPLWGGICGKTEGKIIKVLKGVLYPYGVRWNNSVNNNISDRGFSEYGPNELDFVRLPQRGQQLNLFTKERNNARRG
uniref:Uncharacterized protein n=1 Tax=viral metagenome TaxID=1070528 RepID=A0A6M3LIE8_9ZZZZ